MEMTSILCGCIGCEQWAREEARPKWLGRWVEVLAMVVVGASVLLAEGCDSEPAYAASGCDVPSGPYLVTGVEKGNSTCGAFERVMRYSGNGLPYDPGCYHEASYQQMWPITSDKCQLGFRRECSRYHQPYWASWTGYLTSVELIEGRIQARDPYQNSYTGQATRTVWDSQRVITCESEYDLTWRRP